MDPIANVDEQYRIIASPRPDLERLGELVEALDSWLAGGGFCPRPPREMAALRSDAIRLMQRGSVGDDLSDGENDDHWCRNCGSDRPCL